jgi:outer membrane protein assembly factor BamB
LSGPAAESSLLPWRLAARLSREVVVPGSPGQLIVLGGLTPGGTSASGVYALRTATGAARQVGALSGPLHDAAGVTSGRRALIFGGGSPVTVGTVQAFSGAGTAHVTGSLPVPRSDAAAVTIGGTAYVVGGYDGINGSWVSEYTPAGKPVWTVQLPISYPSDPQQLGPDRYLIADYASPGQILEFNREGRILYRYRAAPGPGTLNHPSLAELLPSGVFMASDDFNDRMVAIDPATGALVWQYGITGKPGTAPGELNTPTASTCCCRTGQRRRTR